MGCRECYAWGEIEEGYFREAADSVMEKLEGEEDIDFSIVAIEGDEHCDDILEKVPVEDEDSFLERCREAETSVSFRSGGGEFIVIRADRDFVREDPEALRGLIAHELMHTVQRRKGVGDLIEESAKEYQDSMIDELRDSGLSDDQINHFVHTVFENAIYSLKDLFTNTSLIEQSFSPELESYYGHMLGLESYCPVPEFYGKEAEVEEVMEAVSFELGLLPSWLPFKGLEREESERIRQRLKECYQRDLPEVTRYVEELEEVYEEKHGDREEFVDAYFHKIVELTIGVIEKKTGE